MSQLASNTIGGHEALRIFSDGIVVPFWYECSLVDTNLHEDAWKNNAELETMLH